MEKIQFIKENIEKMNIEISEKQCNQFLKYYEMLVETNKVMNLTGITDFKEVVTKHFVDSISLVKSINVNNYENMIDVGTGAGFPGIPIKIMFPKLKIILIDSLNKRINFLNEVISDIQLNEIELIHGRAEDIAKNCKYREKFDLCVSRAVANISTLSEYCLPFLKINGMFVCYKTGNSIEEINVGKKAIKIFGGEIEKIIDFDLPDTDISRKIINIRKKNVTPKKYPRKAGVPSKEPIK